MKKFFNPQFYGAAGYIDRGGNFIPSAVGRTAGGVQTVQAFGQGMQAAAQCGPKGNYTFPDQFNLSYTNGTGAAVLVKFTQADNMTEAMIGSIGTAFFTVQQLPFGNGSVTKQDGTLINGAESLARSLQTFGMKIGKIVLTGSAITVATGYGQTATINAWRGNLSGANQENWTLNLDQNNASAQITLSTLFTGSGMDLTSNVSFNLSVPANSSVNLQFIPVGTIPYIG